MSVNPLNFSYSDAITKKYLAQPPAEKIVDVKRFILSLEPTFKNQKIDKEFVNGCTIYNGDRNTLLLPENQIEMVGIDAEWKGLIDMTVGKNTFRNSHMLTKQMTCFTRGGKRFHILLWNADYELPNDWAFALLEEIIIVKRCDVQEETINQVIYDLNLNFKLNVDKKGIETKTDIPCFMYFSFLDARCLLNTEVLKTLLKGFLPEADIDTFKSVDENVSHFSKKRNLSAKIDFMYGVNNNTVPLRCDPLDKNGILIPTSKKELNDEYYENVRIVLYDLIGAFNTSLDGAFNMVGMDNITKFIVPKERKGSMDLEMIESPELFLFYAMGDTKDTLPLWQKRVDQNCEIIKNALKFDLEYTIHDCPRTSGALVSDTFMRWLEHFHPFLIAGVEALAIPQKSKKFVFDYFLSQLEPQKQFVKEGFMMLYLTRKAKNPTKVRLRDLHKLWDGYDRSKEKVLGSVSGMGRGSIAGFAGVGNNETKFNSIVFGGRCNNENPYKWVLKKGLDIDLSSCYGSALRKDDFPVGRPTIINGLKGVNKGLTVKTFFEKFIYGDEKFAKGQGCWQVVLSSQVDKKGDFIPFKYIDQDYFYGKYDVTLATIDRDVKNGYNVNSDGGEKEFGLVDNVEKSHIKGTPRIAKKVIHNAIGTVHDLQAIYENILSPRERKEFENVRVITAAGYLEADEIKLLDGDGYDSLDEKFYDIMANPKTRGDMAVVDEKDVRYNLDHRTTKWLRLPLENFIGNIIDYRGKLKGLKKDFAAKKDYVKSSYYDVNQNACKLFINTLYGCLAAPYFPIGNTILANNITSKARFGVWQLNKALATTMSITDGGAYEYNKVRVLDPSKNKNLKPSFSTLSNFEKLNKHDSITKTKIIDNFDKFYKDCQTGNINKLHRELDAIATKHVNDFWSHYNLKLEFDVEHKEDNTFLEAIVYNKSDYIFIEPLKPKNKISILKGEIKEVVEYKDDFTEFHPIRKVINYTPKVRGARDLNHPKKMWLFAIAGYIKMYPKMFDFEYEQLIGTNQYINAINGKDPDKKAWCDYTLPGNVIKRKLTLNPTTNHLLQDDYESYKKIDLNNNNRRKRLDKQILNYWRYEIFRDLLNPFLKCIVKSDRTINNKVLKHILKNGGVEYVAKELRPFNKSFEDIKKQIDDL